ncbi:L-rhamnose-binding lectin CSL3-like [Mytilus trossulus]|uniref:L-rhamnose-binding lectin CSL3-like n=1 Tax=Mytilus trossulus TaxID=6551 RepID=UPI003005A6D7
MMRGLFYICFFCISVADNCGKTVSIQEDILHSLVSMQRPSCGGNTKFGLTSVIVCHGISVYLRCTYPFKINIKAAVYGRLDKSICPEGPAGTTSCKSKTSDAKIKAQCNGKEICRVNADARLYGDPCFGIYKYLDVKYTCF